MMQADVASSPIDHHLPLHTGGGGGGGGGGGYYDSATYSSSSSPSTPAVYDSNLPTSSSSSSIYSNSMSSTNIRQDHENIKRLEKENFDLKMKVYYLLEKVHNQETNPHSHGHDQQGDDGDGLVGNDNRAAADVNDDGDDNSDDNGKGVLPAQKSMKNKSYNSSMHGIGSSNKNTSIDNRGNFRVDAKIDSSQNYSYDVATVATLEKLEGQIRNKNALLQRAREVISELESEVERLKGVDNTNVRLERRVRSLQKSSNRSIRRHLDRIEELENRLHMFGRDYAHSDTNMAIATEIATASIIDRNRYVESDTKESGASAISSKGSHIRSKLPKSRITDHRGDRIRSAIDANVDGIEELDTDGAVEIDFDSEAYSEDLDFDTYSENAGDASSRHAMKGLATNSFEDSFIPPPRPSSFLSSTSSSPSFSAAANSEKMKIEHLYSELELAQVLHAQAVLQVSDLEHQLADQLASNEDLNDQLFSIHEKTKVQCRAVYDSLTAEMVQQQAEHRRTSELLRAKIAGLEEASGELSGRLTQIMGEKVLLEGVKVALESDKAALEKEKALLEEAKVELNSRLLTLSASHDRLDRLAIGIDLDHTVLRGICNMVANKLSDLTSTLVQRSSTTLTCKDSEGDENDDLKSSLWSNQLLAERGIGVVEGGGIDVTFDNLEASIDLVFTLYNTIVHSISDKNERDSCHNISSSSCSRDGIDNDEFVDIDNNYVDYSGQEKENANILISINSNSGSSDSDSDGDSSFVVDSLDGLSVSQEEPLALASDASQAVGNFDDAAVAALTSSDATATFEESQDVVRLIEKLATTKAALVDSIRANDDLRVELEGALAKLIDLKRINGELSLRYDESVRVKDALEGQITRTSAELAGSVASYKELIVALRQSLGDSKDSVAALTKANASLQEKLLRSNEELDKDRKLRSDHHLSEFDATFRSIPATSTFIVSAASVASSKAYSELVEHLRILFESSESKAFVTIYENEDKGVTVDVAEDGEASSVAKHLKWVAELDKLFAKQVRSAAELADLYESTQRENAELRLRIDDSLISTSSLALMTLRNSSSSSSSSSKDVNSSNKDANIERNNHAGSSSSSSSSDEDDRLTVVAGQIIVAVRDIKSIAHAQELASHSFEGACRVLRALTQQQEEAKEMEKEKDSIEGRRSRIAAADSNNDKGEEKGRRQNDLSVLEYSRQLEQTKEVLAAGLEGCFRVQGQLIKALDELACLVQLENKSLPGASSTAAMSIADSDIPGDDNARYDVNVNAIASMSTKTFSNSAGASMETRFPLPPTAPPTAITSPNVILVQNKSHGGSGGSQVVGVTRISSPPPLPLPLPLTHLTSRFNATPLSTSSSSSISPPSILSDNSSYLSNHIHNQRSSSNNNNSSSSINDHHLDQGHGGKFNSSSFSPSTLPSSSNSSTKIPCYSGSEKDRGIGRMGINGGVVGGAVGGGGAYLYDEKAELASSSSASFHSTGTPDMLNIGRLHHQNDANHWFNPLSLSSSLSASRSAPEHAYSANPNSNLNMSALLSISRTVTTKNKSSIRVTPDFSPPSPLLSCDLVNQVTQQQYRSQDLNHSSDQSQIRQQEGGEGGGAGAGGRRGQSTSDRSNLDRLHLSELQSTRIGYSDTRSTSSKVIGGINNLGRFSDHSSPIFSSAIPHSSVSYSSRDFKSNSYTSNRTSAAKSAVDANRTGAGIGIGSPTTAADNAFKFQQQRMMAIGNGNGNGNQIVGSSTGGIGGDNRVVDSLSRLDKLGGSIDILLQKLSNIDL